MVKLITYNIEYCEGIQGMWYEYLKFWRIFKAPKGLDDKIIKALRKIKPDILALIEVDTGSMRSKGRDEVEYLQKKLGLDNFVEKVKYPITGWLKLFHKVPILRSQANAILSKYKLEKTKYHLLNKGTKRMVIEVTVKCPKPVTLLVAHLALGKKARANQIKQLSNIVNTIKNPVILMGDFNTFNGEAEITNLLKDTRLQDKISLDKKSLPYTEPSWHPTRRLDYILTSPKIKVKKYSILNYRFSDHLPLMIEFSLK